MRKIYKLVLNPFVTKYSMPTDAKIIKVGWQRRGGRGDVCAWYEFQHGSPYAEEERTIRVIPTGIAFESDGLRYIGSAVSDDLVFHIYSE